MKIVYLADSYIPSKTANSVHVMKMCEAFAQNGHEVTLVAQYMKKGMGSEEEDVYTYYGVEPIFSIKAIKTPSVKGKLFFFVLQALPFIRKKCPDLIYGRSLLGLYFSRILATPIIYEGHTTLWDSSPFYSRIFHRFLRSASLERIIVISNALKRILLDDFSFLAEEKIQVVHDAASFPQKAEEIDFHFNSGKLKIGYIGSVYPGRGIELLINCADKLPETELHIVGGTKEDILTKLKVKKIPENVVFHGFVPPSAVSAYREKMHILAAPYQSEIQTSGGRNTSAYMSPLKVFEYMSSRKAIVCSDLPVLREVLNEKNAILVPSEDKQAWLKAFVSLHDTGLREKLATQAFQDFEENYTWYKRAQLVLK